MRVDYLELTRFLENLHPDQIQREVNKNVVPLSRIKLFQATSEYLIEHQNVIPDNHIKHIIKYKEPCLMDYFSGDLSVVYLTNTLLTHPNGSKTPFKFDKKLINFREIYGFYLSGIYKIPEQFLIK